MPRFPMHHMYAYSYIDDLGVPIHMDMLDQECNLTDRKTIAVIGAGIAGVTIAYSLVRRGYEVEIIETESLPAMRTSYANGGQLSVSNSDTWCTWHNVGKALKWMLRSDAPLLVKPLPTMSKMRWMAGFLWHTARGTHRANTLRTIELGMWSRGLYDDIAHQENIRFDHSKRGILHIYKDQRSFENGAELARFYTSNGVDRYVVSLDEITKLDPALDRAPGLVGGTYTPSDSMGDIHQFTTGLAQVLEGRHGVEFLYGHRVVDIIDQDTNMLVCMAGPDQAHARSYAHVVIAAGADSARFGSMIEDRVNVYPVKGYSITIPNVDQDLLPRTSLLDDDAKIVTSTLGDRLRIAGTAELDGWNRDIRHARIEPLARWVNTNLPNISTEHAIPWAGLRPMSSDMMPIARRSKKNRRVWWHTGHGHLGFTLSPATAEIVADQISRSMEAAYQAWGSI
jgi:D-amino-acid dehydrogenase